MFSGGFVESNKEIVVIKDISNAVLNDLIDFMYTGKLITINDDNVEEILNGADILQLTEVRLKCTKFFMATIVDNNCLKIKDIGDSRGITELSQNCLEHALARFHFVSREKSFLDIDITQLIELIKNDNLSVPDEKYVYMAVMAWVKHDESGRKHLLPELLDLVRLVFISQDYLLKVIKAEPLIYSNPECLKMITKVTDHFSYKHGDSLSKIITNVKPRNKTKMSTTEYMDLPRAACKIPDCEFKNAINLFAYFDNFFIETLFTKVEWNFGMNEENFLKEWDEEWKDVNSADSSDESDQSDESGEERSHDESTF
ncbi:kelch-like protein 17 isoform X2 [Rhopalosiphum maidis]|nr:kelch-like protein 17 isoform X2 [Rhopalosiphum maidis]